MRDIDLQAALHRRKAALQTSPYDVKQLAIRYALTQGQTLGPKLLFVPIPKPVLVASEKTLKKVQS